MGQDGNIVQFKIKKHTALKKLMSTYCERAGLALQVIFLLFSNVQQFISFSARLFGSHLMEPASMKVTLRRALTWRYISRIAPGFGTYTAQDGDTIEVFQQQSGGSWGGREGSACCCLFEKSNPPLRCSVRALSILSLWCLWSRSGKRQNIFSDHQHYKHLLKTMPSHPLIHNSLGVLNSILSQTENILTDSATLYSYKSYELCRVLQIESTTQQSFVFFQAM